MKVLYILSNSGLDGSFLTWASFLREATKHDITPYVICKPELTETEYFKYFQHELGFRYKTMMVYESVKHFPPKPIKARLHWYLKLVRAMWPKLKFLRKLILYAKDVKPDIIHTNVGTVHEGLWASLFLRVPHIWHLREYQDIGCEYWIYPTKSIFKKILRLSYVITLTEDLLKYYDLAQYKRAVVIPDGVYYKSEVFFEENKQKYLLCASRIHHQKHIDDAIKAFAIIASKYPDYKLLLAGDGGEDYVEEMKKMAKEIGYGDRINFLGFCAKEQIKQLMQNAKAVLVPSTFEGFGLMTAEAAFNGTMVVGRAEGGTYEIIKETGGFSFNGDYTQMAKEIEKVINLNEEEYRIMSLKAQKVAVEKYTIESTCAQIVDYYHRIIK